MKVTILCLIWYDHQQHLKQDVMVRDIVSTARLIGVCSAAKNWYPTLISFNSGLSHPAISLNFCHWIIRFSKAVFDETYLMLSFI